MSTPSGSDLDGKSILIVEDSFYLAVEIKEEIVRAGGKVTGPCADAKDSLAELGRGTPDGAVVDINLGSGPSFEIADALHAAGVPFLFLTGYDAARDPRAVRPRRPDAKAGEHAAVAEKDRRLDCLAWRRVFAEIGGVELTVAGQPLGSGVSGATRSSPGSADTPGGRARTARLVRAWGYSNAGRMGCRSSEPSVYPNGA